MTASINVLITIALPTDDPELRQHIGTMETITAPDPAAAAIAGVSPANTGLARISPQSASCLARRPR
jgi:hypothetical protein